MSNESEFLYRRSPFELTRVIDSAARPSTESAEAPLSPRWSAAERALSATRGLPNLGNTCYFNSLLQILLNTPPLARATSVAHNCDRSCLTCDFLALAAARGGDPRRMVEHLAAPTFRPHRQQDPHELFLLLLGRFAAPLRRPFEGSLTSSVRCARGHLSTCAEPFLNLSLDIAGGSLHSALARFFAPETQIAGYYCATCGRRGPASKAYALRAAPAVLALQLLRFNARGEKVSRAVRLAPTLELGGRFELFGVVEHRGEGTRSGHYVAYVRAPNGLWHRVC